MVLKVLKISFLAFLIVLCACASKQASNLVTDWEPLFEDQSMFRYDGVTDWSKNNGQICNIIGSGDGYLITNKKYDSFELQFEFKPDATVNSGIFIRCKDSQMSYEDCYELNIWDEHPDQSNRTGSIVTRATANKKVSTIGKWNTMRIIAQDNRIQISINNMLVLDYNEADNRPGVIGFQAYEEGEICFRNIRIKEN